MSKKEKFKAKMKEFWKKNWWKLLLCALSVCCTVFFMKAPCCKPAREKVGNVLNKLKPVAKVLVTAAEIPVKAANFALDTVKKIIK